LTLKDLQASFTPKPEEIKWAQQQSRTPQRRLALLVLLKCFEFLRHFPALDAIPAEVVENISATLGVAPTDKIEFASLATLYRHHKAIRELLGVKPYTDGQTRALAIQIAQQVASVVETRVDIINITIEELVRLGYELPVFRTLDEISEQAHSAAEAALHERINQRLSWGPLVFSAITGGTQTQHWRGGGVGRSLILLAFLFTSQTGIVASH
jgi:hypothetical protein